MPVFAAVRLVVQWMVPVFTKAGGTVDGASICCSNASGTVDGASICCSKATRLMVQWMVPVFTAVSRQG